MNQAPRSASRAVARLGGVAAAAPRGAGGKNPPPPLDTKPRGPAPTADTAAHSDKATTVAKGIDGVKSVDSRLTVKP